MKHFSTYSKRTAEIKRGNAQNFGLLTVIAVEIKDKG